MAWRITGWCVTVSHDWNCSKKEENPIKESLFQNWLYSLTQNAISLGSDEPVTGRHSWADVRMMRRKHQQNVRKPEYFWRTFSKFNWNNFSFCRWTIEWPALVEPIYAYLAISIFEEMFKFIWVHVNGGTFVIALKEIDHWMVKLCSDQWNISRATFFVCDWIAAIEEMRTGHWMVRKKNERGESNYFIL